MTPFPRADLPTPALVIDRPAMERNIAAMARFAAASGVALRPHAKTYKSAVIAQAQIAAGAVGACCAKLGEAEALAAGGVGDLLITSPVVARGAVERLARLNERVERLAVVVDHPDNLDRIAGAAMKPIELLVDIDLGSHRTGVASPEDAVALARWIAERPTLRYRGVQFYCGTLQHVAGHAERRAAIAERTAYLADVLVRLRDAGLAPAVVTGGGTGSFAIDAELGVLTEVQPGSYVFMDREYADCERGDAPRFEPALLIDARVVSANHPGRATIDAGLKAMATEAGPPRVLAGADPESRYVFMGDEHGMLLTPEGAGDLALDARITLQPPHCDPTVNLYDRYAVCEGDAVVDFWPVDARGRSA